MQKWVKCFWCWIMYKYRIIEWNWSGRQRKKIEKHIIKQNCKGSRTLLMRTSKWSGVPPRKWAGITARLWFFWWLSAKTRANTYYEERNKFGFWIFGAGCKRNHDNHIKRPWHEIARNLCLNMESKWRGCVFRFKHGISLARLCSCLKKCKLCWRSSRGDCTWPDCHDGDDDHDGDVEDGDDCDAWWWW